MRQFSKKKIAFLAMVCLTAILCFKALFAAEPEEDFGNEIVVFSNGLLNINAKEIRLEDLMKEIGEKCGIKIVVYGKVFSEVPIGLRFQNMPVRKGIERVLRLAHISNYLMHFEDGEYGSRIAEIDLIGKRGGEKYLTEGSPVKPKPRERGRTKDSSKKRRKKEALKNQVEKEDAREIQENFLSIMDEILNYQLEEGGEPDPAEILRLFKEVVPPEMKDQISPEVLEELEKLE